MKHILPVLTVSALAAAASAQTAPAPSAKQALSYNRVIVSHVTTNDSVYDNGASVFAQAKIGGGIYIAASTLDLNNASELDGVDNTVAVLGYAYTLPSFIGITSDLNVQVGYKSVGVGIRALIGGGVEIDVSHTHGVGGDGNDLFSVGASYNLGFLVKGLSLNASYDSYSGAGNPDVTSVGIGYNF